MDGCTHAEVEAPGFVRLWHPAGVDGAPDSLRGDGGRRNRPPGLHRTGETGEPPRQPQALLLALRLRVAPPPARLAQRRAQDLAVVFRVVLVHLSVDLFLSIVREAPDLRLAPVVAQAGDARKFAPDTTKDGNVMQCVGRHRAVVEVQCLDRLRDAHHRPLMRDSEHRRQSHGSEGITLRKGASTPNRLFADSASNTGPSDLPSPLVVEEVAHLLR
mmetsp:Transcript_54958/g.178614  ORF Transcript_54958/g.178614 Transcript_54958/m.178614 type:complete len:216 (-) Transcript_54958:2369-3016(-)